LTAADHGHDHDTAHEHDHGPGDEDRPSVAVTQWTGELELFMEYPLLHAAEAGRFIVHLTLLDGFQPIREGRLTLAFIRSGGDTLRFERDELLRDAIFAPTVQVHVPGDHSFSVSYTGHGIVGHFSIGEFTVYPPVEVIADQKEGGGEGITFLKEQQWRIPFATEEVERREMKRAIRAIAEVLPDPAAYAEIVAPVDGTIHVGSDGRLALPGSVVKQGDALATLTPLIQGEGWVSSRFAYEQARREYERARRLRERQAISEREYERLRDDYLAKQAGLEALSGTGEGNLLVLSAPLAGKVIDWQVRPGRRVAAGDFLMAVVNPEWIWLRVNVYENDYRRLGRPVGLYIKPEAGPEGWLVESDDLEVLTSGGTIDPVTRTIPLLLKVRNSDGSLLINDSTPVELYSSFGEEAFAVPIGALYEDNGLYVVFVQTGGESFEKRIVATGPAYAGWRSIRSGLNVGERVVTRGGYQVKLASTSATIGHGHAH